MLLGLLVDVSSSMMSSIQSRSRTARTRLESFRNSFDDLVRSAARLCTEGVGGRVSPRLSLFAYGFGFGNPIGFLLGDDGPKVRDLLLLEGDAESAVTIDRLARTWPTYQEHIKSLVPSMFGETPMAEAFQVAGARIGREHASRAYAPPPILFIVSDGEPTDASVDAVRAVAEEIRADDVVIVSCLLTDEDLTESRRLYGSPQPGWPQGARLMFECASALPLRSPFDAYLIEHRWTVDPDARLFTQINQSEVLAEFSKVILSPLDPSDHRPATASAESPVRVFVTYSHEDAGYLDDDSLLGYLSPLRDEGLEFFSDRDIATGDLWETRIRAAIDSTDIVIALVSQAFLSSDYCQNVEMERFLAARREFGTRILPIILRPCDWQAHDWLAETQARPGGTRTIELDYDTRAKRDQAFLEILRDLRQAAEAVRGRRGGR